LQVIDQASNNLDNIELISKWRDNNQEWFPSHFSVSVESTQKWLNNLINIDSNRILFFVSDRDGNKVGHVGLNRFDYHLKTCELDNIIRGEKVSNINIMKLACEKIISFAINELNIKNIYLRVFSDNERAIKLYTKLGFKEILRVPLEKIEKNNQTSWIELNGDPHKEVNRYFVTMILK
jgi:RimJ/RimL family protein N-acetyltransferase